MATISEKLEQLENDRQDLVDNLETLGIDDLDGDETFTELVPRILDVGNYYVRKDSFVYDSQTQTLTITIS